MADRADITPELLRQLLHYDPQTGIFVWQKRNDDHFPAQSLVGMPSVAKKWNSNFAGKVAGHKNKAGYIQLTINLIHYNAHRIAWMMHYGRPLGALFIDHINGVRDDNRISNLRLATSHDNLKNAQIGRRNSSGFMGISWDQSRNKWRANISDNGRYVALGRFARIEDAFAARKAAERAFGYHQNHGRKGPIRETTQEPPQ